MGSARLSRYARRSRRTPWAATPSPPPFTLRDMNVMWEQDGGVGRITLNRPDSLNAWTEEFGRELKQVIIGDAAADRVRAVLVTGAGRGFSSGADLKAG